MVLYGNSLVMSTIGASLRAHSGLELVRLEPGAPDAAQRLLALHPDVVLFDLATAEPDFAVTLLKQHSKLLLIGVDLANARMLVLSGHESNVLTVDDLLHVIADQ